MHVSGDYETSHVSSRRDLELAADWLLTPTNAVLDNVGLGMSMGYVFLITYSRLSNRSDLVGKILLSARVLPIPIQGWRSWGKRGTCPLNNWCGETAPLQSRVRSVVKKFVFGGKQSPAFELCAKLCHRLP